MNITDNERQLIKKCIRQNSKAQFLFYEKYKTPLFGLCLRYAKSEAEANDFLQEGFINIFQSLSQYKEEGPILNWLKRVVINRILSLLRKKQLKFDKNIDLKELQNAQVVVNNSSELAEELIELIQQLPSGYQTVFNLYAIEGYSHKEIAALLNISESTSRSQYFRARKAIKTAFQNHKSMK